MKNFASYNGKDFSPPAPVLLIGFALPDEDPRYGTHSALIDTGADGTFVPTRLIEEMNLPVAYMTNARSYLTEPVRRVAVHTADVILFDSIRLPNIELVADDWGDKIIIGRNILNKLRLLLDGPNMKAELLE